ncbi:YeeE/YedE family protein [bacterium]|nr:YeeE/YedE family protein [bacterium]
MLSRLHTKKGLQLFLGFLMGILFGFLLHKGGVTKYDVIIGQLLLVDFTVVKIMLSAVIVGMVGIYVFKALGLAQLHPKPGSVGMTVIGSLFFGIGFATLGYCPGTVAGAVGSGAMDALAGGVVGILIGAAIFAVLYPRLNKVILNKGYFGEVTIPQLLKVNEWVVIIPAVIVIAVVLFWIEKTGL